MIETVGLCKSFGETTVLSNADLKIEDGSIFGLVGVNGAGKSTLLRLLSGVIREDSGKIWIDDENVYENEKVKQKIFFLPDDPYYEFLLTGKKLRAFYETFYSLDEEIFRHYIEYFKLDLSKPIRNFSKGMKRQMFLSIAFACAPEYLFLDEAFDGLDPLARLECKRGLIQMQEKGCTVVIASHSLRELEDICDSFALLDGHKVKNYGKIDEELEKLKKYQLVFEKELSENDLPFPCLKFERTGRVVRIVVRGSEEEIRGNIDALHPLVVDEIPMDFEDLFLYEAGERGDLV